MMKRILKIAFYGVVAYREMADWKKVVLLCVLMLLGLALVYWGRG